MGGNSDRWVKLMRITFTAREVSISHQSTHEWSFPVGVSVRLGRLAPTSAQHLHTHTLVPNQLSALEAGRDPPVLGASIGEPRIQPTKGRGGSPPTPQRCCPGCCYSRHGCRRHHRPASLRTSTNPTVTRASRPRAQAGASRIRIDCCALAAVPTGAAAPRRPPAPAQPRWG